MKTQILLRGTGGVIGDYVKIDGTTPLTADWNAGSFRITAGAITSTDDGSISGMTIGKGAGSIASNIVFGSNALPNNTTGNQLTAIGRFSLFSNISGVSNTAIGNTTMYNNTTGNSNTAIGRTSMYNNTTGSDNTGIGQSALYNNTIGSYNTAIGRSSSTGLESGNGNSTLGWYALGSNVTGNYNISMGYRAGRYLSDGTTANSTPNNSIYIGSDTSPFSIADTNQIVIGHQAIGMGSDTTVLGKQGVTTDTYLAGYLHINAAYRLPNTDGTVNQVLQTDGFGGVTWATVTSGSGGITSLNGLLVSTQTFAVGTAGTDFAISSTGSAHTFNIPTASVTNRGVLSSTDWSTFNGKQDALGYIPLNKAGDTMTGSLTLGASLILAGTVNSSLSGANVRIPSHTTCNVTFTNASLTSIGSANNGGVVDGHTLFLTNATGVSITIINNYASAAAGEAIFTGTTTDTTIPDKGSFWLRWNATTNSWLCSSSGVFNIQDSQIASASTWNSKQDSLSLTTIGTSGAATLIGSTLNIPQYSGGATVFIPSPGSSEIFRGRTFRYDSTTTDTFGGINTLNNASAIAVAPNATNFGNKYPRLRYYASIVSTGRVTSIRSTDLQWYVGGGFRFVSTWRVADTVYGATCQNFHGLIGITTEIAVGTVSAIQVSTLTNCIFIGSDSADTNLQVMHNDASGTCTKIDLGVGFPANRTAGAAMTTMYACEIYNSARSTEVKYQVTNLETGDVAQGTITTNLPATTQGLAIQTARVMGTATTNTGQWEQHKWGCSDIIA